MGSGKKEVSNLNLNDILFNQEACMGCGPCKLRRFVAWSPASVQVLKLNMEGASRGQDWASTYQWCAL